MAGAGVTAGKCLILVLSVYGKTFGLWVDSVLDIVESAAEIQLSSGSPSVLGAADIQGTAVEFIDAGYYFRKAFEESLRGADKSKANLLIVDSEAGAHDMLRPILTAAGHKVTAVETAELATSFSIRSATRSSCSMRKWPAKSMRRRSTVRRMRSA